MGFNISNIKMYYSGAASASGIQTNIENSLGGYISSSEIPNASFNNLFTDISGTDTISGTTIYKALFVKNTDVSMWNNGKIFIYSMVGSSYEDIYFGAESHVGGYIQTISDKYTSPTGVSWYNPDDIESGISIGDITPQNFFGFWIKKVIIPSSGTGEKIHSITIAFSADVY